ncbi:MAG TPA: hypothetical protein V6C90_26155 [Coleofasciculaceae cyanobacterium]
MLSSDRHEWTQVNYSALRIRYVTGLEEEKVLIKYWLDHRRKIGDRVLVYSS